MWKAAAGQDVKASKAASNDDDWDTDPDFVNDVSEKEQRKGAKTIEGSIKPKDAVDVSQLRNKVVTQNEEVVKKEYVAKGTFAAGYGGKYGVQTDRMDKSAVGFEDKNEPKADHSSVPKYQKPTVTSAPASSIKSKFEQLNSAVDADKAQQEKIAAERAARAEKERQERERVKKEQDAQAAKDKAAREAETAAKAKAKAEAEAKAHAEAEARAQAEAEARAQAEAEAEAAAQAAAQEQHQHQHYEEPQQEEPQQEEPQQQNYEEQPQQNYEEPQQSYDQSGYEQEAAAAAAPAEPAAAAGSYTAVALYEYEGGGDDELPFKEGETITNIEFIDDGWWRGECNGRYGLFPANYVQLNQ